MDIETTDIEKAEPESAALAKTQDVKAFLEDKFGWLTKYLPGLQLDLSQYASADAQAAFLAKVDHDGLVENHIDAMDALRVFLVDLITILVADLCGTQIKRLKPDKNGTMSECDARTLQRLVEAMQRTAKVATEIREAAGFSRKARHEIGNPRGDALQKVLDDIERQELPDKENMTRFFGGGALRVLDIPENQVEVFDEPVSTNLSKEEIKELICDTK